MFLPLLEKQVIGDKNTLLVHPDDSGSTRRFEPCRGPEIVVRVLDERPNLVHRKHMKLDLVERRENDNRYNDDH